VTETTAMESHDSEKSMKGSEDTLLAKGLSKSFRRRRVVNQITVEVQRGEVVGLLGPNGAGKTTTFYMIAGVIRADEGEIFLSGKNVTGLPIHKRARQGLGYLPQERSVFRRLTAEQNLMSVLEYTDVPIHERQERVDQGLEELHLTQIRNSMGFQLSGGEARRVEIARALVMQPDFVLLDEPFAGVDPIAVLDIQEVIKQIKAKNIGVLITDHNVRETLGITDRAYIVNQGEVLVQGGPEELANNEVAKKIYLGDQFSL